MGVRNLVHTGPWLSWQSASFATRRSPVRIRLGPPLRSSPCSELRGARTNLMNSRKLYLITAKWCPAELQRRGAVVTMYYVYILQSKKDDSCYIGVTTDLKRRIQEHNSGSTKYSNSKRPYKLIWYCSFPNKRRAYDFERYLKSSSGYAFTKKRLV